MTSLPLVARSRTLHLLWLYIHRQMLGVLSWRGFMIELTLQQTITPLLGLAIWSAALPGSDVVRTYFVALLAVQMFTVCYEANTYMEGIANGDFANDLLRPHAAVLQVLGDSLAWRAWHVALGAPVVLAAALIAQVSFDVGLVLLALPAVLLAAALRFLFSYVTVLTALWTHQAGNVVAFGSTLVFLLGGAAAPITFFPEQVRPLGEALPFRAMLGFPAEIAGGSLTLTQVAVGYAWQVGWTVLFAGLAVVVWRAGVRRYVAIGG